MMCELDVLDDNDWWEGHHRNRAQNDAKAWNEWSLVEIQHAWQKRKASICGVGRVQAHTELVSYISILKR